MVQVFCTGCGDTKAKRLVVSKVVVELSPDKTGADIMLNGELADIGDDYILAGSGTQEWTSLAMLADCDPSTLLSSVPRVLPASAVASP